MRTWAACAGVLLCSCVEPVTETVVTGSIRGVRLPRVVAAGQGDTVLFGHRHTVWIGNAPVCERLRQAPLGDPRAFEPSFLRLPDGSQEPLLILQTTGTAWFDTGQGRERIDGTVTIEQFRLDGAGTASARFVATFPGESGRPDEVTGSFVARDCDNAAIGCTSAPRLFVVGAAVMLVRRRRKRHGSCRG